MLGWTYVLHGKHPLRDRTVEYRPSDNLRNHGLLFKGRQPYVWIFFGINTPKMDLSILLCHESDQVGPIGKHDDGLEVEDVIQISD